MWAPAMSERRRTVRQRASGASQAGSGGGSMPAVSRLLMVAGLSIVLVLALVVVDVVVLRVNNPARALGNHYYMALCDSLFFGYQPILDLSAGFADDIFNDLRPASVTEEINYACAGETTTTMIDGGCILRFAHHGSYTGAQLHAAIHFLNNPKPIGRGSPITPEVRSQQCPPKLNSDTC